MPILVKGDKSKVAADLALLKQKREERKQRRTKYQLVRKDKTPEDYKKIQVYVDGKEMELSDSSKYFLDMLLQEKQE